MRWRAGALLAIFLLLGGGETALAHEGEQHGTPPATTVGLGPVKLSEEAKRYLDLQVEEVGLRGLEGLVHCFGVVQPAPGKVYWSTTRIDGRVTSIAVNPGDAVRAGDLLAEVEARQVAGAPVDVTVRAGIAGRVTEQNVAVGQPIAPETTLFKIMDLSTVIVECHVYEADIGRVRQGQRIRIFPETLAGEHFTGTIERVGGQLGGEGRTLPVWAALPNAGEVLKPGMQGRVEIVAGEARDVVAAPVAAVLGEAGNYFVFAENGDYYVGQPVGLGLRDSAFVEVTDGLLPGYRVVTRGAYQRQIAAAATAAGAAPAGEKRAEKNAERRTAPAPPPGIRLSDVARRNIGLVTEEVETRPIDRVVHSFGVIEAVPARASVITTLVSGRATRVVASEGERVRAGDLLAAIESRQVAEPPPVVEVRATRSGTITVQHVFAGEPVEPRKSLFTVVDLSKVLVRCHIYEADIGRVTVGQRARVVSDAFPGEVFSGTVEFVGRELEPGSRTLPLWVGVANPVEKLKLNMLVEVHLIVGVETEAIAVPLAAVLGRSESRFVFVAEGDALKRQVVSIGPADDRYAAVMDGLLPGDRVVVRGNESLEFATSSPAALGEPAGGKP